MNPQQNQLPQMMMPGQQMPPQGMTQTQGGSQVQDGPQTQGMPPQMMMPGQQMPPQMPGQQMLPQSMSQTQGGPQTQGMPPQMVMPGQQMPPQMQGQQMSSQGMPQASQTVMPGQQAPQNPNMANLGSTAMQANAKAPASARKDSPTSTQATLLISELRDNVVIMKDGSFRAVVACKSINFDLMSEMEREGVEYSYQNFLNSLKFTTQIMIRSQRVDIGPYLERLTEIRRNNDNMLLGVLMDDYINFVDALSQEANIMDKSFFIVIPYYISEDTEKSLQQTKNFFKTFSKSKGPEITRIDRPTYDKAMSELTNRVDSVMSGLFQIGIHSVRLNTKELAELYYNFNNPDTAVREPLVDFSKLANIYVKKGENEEEEKVNG